MYIVPECLFSFCLGKSTSDVLLYMIYTIFSHIFFQVTKKAKSIKTSGYATHVDAAAQGMTLLLY